MTSDRFRVAVGLRTHEHGTQVAYGIVKQTLGCDGHELPAAALTPDPAAHGRGVLLEPDTDFAIDKPWVDLVVLGDVIRTDASLYATAVLSIGPHRRQIVATGARALERDGRGGFRASAPSSWERVSMAWTSAYGGCDRRVPVPTPRTLDQAIVCELDHPGLYPRNPFGTGYAVLPRDLAGLPLPQLEDPDDPITRERLAAGAPERWHRQPRPACWAWAWPLQFPRYAWAGMRAWHPAPTDARLVEVATHELPAELPSCLERQPELRHRFWNAAAPGLAFPQLETRTPIVVHGMSASARPFSIEIPAPPPARLQLGSTMLHARARLAQVVLEPNLGRAHLTWHLVEPCSGARWVPGVHRDIPLALLVEGNAVGRYQAPEPLRRT